MKEATFQFPPGCERDRQTIVFLPFRLVQFDINVRTQPYEITEPLVFVRPRLLQSPTLSVTRNVN